MSQQTIGIGSAPDDGTGDQLRTAFNKANLNFTECYNASQNLQAANALSALVIDTSKKLNTKTISADSTFTFSGAPTSGTRFALKVHNSDVSLSKKITFPSSFSVARHRTVTTAAATVSGDTFLEWYYDGSTYFVFGDTPELNPDAGQFTYVAGHNAGQNATAAEYSVYIGEGAGQNQNYGTNGQAVAVGYGAGQNPGGYAGTFIGYLAGNAGGGTSAVGLGYGAMASAGSSGVGNVAIGVHAAEAMVTMTGTTAIGYHTLNAGSASTAQNSVAIGDHAGANTGISADNCIFLGTYSGISRNSTLWIDATATSFDTRKPLIYGEFDNRKFTINGDGLFGRSATNDAAAASAALEVRSTSQGFLLPRMTKTQRNAISSPATGLAVFQTDNTPGLRVYNGTNWMKYTETTD